MKLAEDDLDAITEDAHGEPWAVIRSEIVLNLVAELRLLRAQREICERKH